MFSYFEPNFFEKFFWESGFCKFWPKSKRREMKIGYLAAILIRYNILFHFISFYLFFFNFLNFILFYFLFFAELWFFYSAYIMVQIALQNSVGKKAFLRGSINPTPLGTNRNESTLVT